MTGELMKLAERVESLTGPDREVDARIACFLDNRSVHDVVDGKVLGRNNRPPHDICIVNWAPHYTSSLDAAMSLVPENFSCETAHSAAPASSSELRFTRCRLWDWRRGPLAIDPANEWKAEGNRPLALNIVAAALKARALARDERGER